MCNVNEIEQLSVEIQNKIKHTYLDKFIKTPVINKDKLTILSVLFKNTTLSKTKQKTSIIATMLVQMALDTHDKVEVTNQLETNESDVTTRQLTVLAGDYYSALYYFLLSEIDDIQLIQTLALAIKEINEYKMQLYYMEFESITDYINVVQKIETTLLTRVADFINQSFLSKVTNQLFITNRLIREKQDFHHTNHSQILNNWLEYSTTSTKQSILNTIELMIQKNMGDLEIALSDPSINTSVIHSQLHWLLKPIFSKTSVAGEG